MAKHTVAEVTETKSYSWKIGESGSIHYTTGSNNILVYGSYGMLGANSTIIKAENLLEFADVLIEVYKIVKGIK